MWNVLMAVVWFVMMVFGVYIYLAGHWKFDLIIAAICAGASAFHFGKIVGWW